MRFVLLDMSFLNSGFPRWRAEVKGKEHEGEEMRIAVRELTAKIRGLVHHMLLFVWCHALTIGDRGFQISGCFQRGSTIRGNSVAIQSAWT